MAQLRTPVYITDNKTSKRLTLDGTNPVLKLNSLVSRETSFTINQLKDASSSAVSSIAASAVVKVMNLPVGAIVEELAIGFDSASSFIGASTAMTAGVGVSSVTLTTTLLTATKSEVVKNQTVSTGHAGVGSSERMPHTVAAAGSTEANVVTFKVTGTKMSHAANALIKVRASYRQA